MKRWFIVLLATGSLAAFAKVSEAEAAKLNGELTPVGAIRAGNGGDIPAWEGGIQAPPDGYRKGTHHVDPFADDAPKYTVSAANADEYAEKLSPGQMAMLKRYPTFKLNVYPTRRSASLPQAVYEATARNAVNATTVDGGNGIAQVEPGVAFPIPQDGTEAIWNHLFRYRGDTMNRVVGQVAPTAGGSFTVVEIDERAIWKYNQSKDNLVAKYLQVVKKPARLAGDILLVFESLDQVQTPRRAWKYNKGLRRSISAPNVAHDHPGTAADGQRTSDNLDMFNGSPERYNWKLVGRREMIVPYNSYKLHSPELTNKNILHKGHINPEHARYELHRVWEVDARLKDGKSHVYGRRTFYLDEDSWQILLVDHYDRDGGFWRLGEAHTINYYEVPFVWDTLQCFYDLDNGRYLVYGLNNEGKIDEFNLRLNEKHFNPNSLRNIR